MANNVEKDSKMPEIDPVIAPIISEIVEKELESKPKRGRKPKVVENPIDAYIPQETTQDIEEYEPQPPLDIVGDRPLDIVEGRPLDVVGDGYCQEDDEGFFENFEKFCSKVKGLKKPKIEFSKLIVFLMMSINVFVIICAVIHMNKTGDATPLAYIGVTDGAGLGSACIFYSKKAMQENKRKIAKGIFDDMQNKYTFEQTVQLLEIICRD